MILKHQKQMEADIRITPEQGDVTVRRLLGVLAAGRPGRYANGVIQFCGTEWKKVDSGTGAWPAGAMWGTPEGELFVEVNGMILKHEPQH